MFGMFGEEPAQTSGEPGAEASTSAWGSIGAALTGAATNLVQQFPAVAKDVIASKVATSNAAAAAKAAEAQAKLTAAETAKLKAQAALATVGKTFKQEASWAVPLLAGGVALLGVALWLRSRKKRAGR